MAKKKGIKVVIENALYHISNEDHSKLLGLLTSGKYEEYNHTLDEVKEKYPFLEEADFFHYQ